MSSKPRKMRDSRRASMLRDAQNLVKYVIRGVIQFFELLNTSLNA
jgi:hypothetical protein